MYLFSSVVHDENTFNTDTFAIHIQENRKNDKKDTIDVYCCNCYQGVTGGSGMELKRSVIRISLHIITKDFDCLSLSTRPILAAVSIQMCNDSYCPSVKLSRGR